MENYFVDGHNVVGHHIEISYYTGDKWFKSAAVPINPAFILLYVA